MNSDFDFGKTFMSLKLPGTIDFLGWEGQIRRRRGTKQMWRKTRDRKYFVREGEFKHGGRKGKLSEKETNMVYEEEGENEEQ